MSGDSDSVSASPEQSFGGSVPDGDQQISAEANTDVVVEPIQDTTLSETPNNADDADDQAIAALISDAVGQPSAAEFLRRLNDGLAASHAPNSPVIALSHQLQKDSNELGDEGIACRTFIDALDDAVLGRDELMQAMPILAALTAWAIVQEVVTNGRRVGEKARLKLVQKAMIATRQAISDQPGERVLPLPMIAPYVVQYAVRHGKPSTAVAAALPRIATRLTNEPQLLQRLIRATSTTLREPARATGPMRSQRSRQFDKYGAVEIRILAR